MGALLQFQLAEVPAIHRTLAKCLQWQSHHLHRLLRNDGVPVHRAPALLARPYTSTLAAINVLTGEMWDQQSGATGFGGYKHTVRAVQTHCGTAIPLT